MVALFSLSGLVDQPTVDCASRLCSVHHGSFKLRRSWAMAALPHCCPGTALTELNEHVSGT